ncbi:hypothetical protein SAMN05421878_10960 [Actinobaculum suis]|uniref:Uncharacterized protein n=1 Tax=Actinobaculum suis TaxID=1657 RepID=A0A1G7D0N6_9ACTO|nr:hypothetical protein [Actinobaculum suis]MDY5152810.1 hypothetical protein [Actinobaculum suis]SDE45081.1 hypothetical protein SAMN05421878_10960 [Actinobaculum suis]
MAEEFDRTIEVKITGLTDPQCVESVTSELTALPNVEHVVVTLATPGKESSALIYTPRDIDDATLTAAITRSGQYTVAEIIR